jgi:osmotically-inducible protein OsmY
MTKQGRLLLVLLILSCFLSGCISNVWTGANLVYDRHDVYKKFNDYQLLIEVNNSLYSDKLLHCDLCILDTTVFNGDILVAGHVPSEALLNEARQRLFQVKDYRHLFIELALSQDSPSGLEDSWITAKIRSRIFGDSTVDPKAFKIVTSDCIVYLMGDVKAEQAERVIHIARSTAGVSRVIKLLNYFTYQPKSKIAEK